MKNVMFLGALALVIAPVLSACNSAQLTAFNTAAGIAEPILCKALSAKGAKATGITTKECIALSGAAIPVVDAIAQGQTAP